MMENPRVLGALRVSVNSDDSTSAEKQEAAIDHWAKGPAIAGSIVGWARDLDVSGGMDPFKRPDLGPWLTERADEWDVLAVHRLDRLTRRSAHFAHLYEWCGKTSKTLVSVTEGIDMSTPMGKMFAQIIAAFAEGELDTIRARALSGSLARMTKGTWIGGVEPFGYRFTQVEDGGKKLVQDPEYVELFWNIVEDIRNDKSSYRIAVDLNKRGILTWRDRLRVLKGKEPRGIRWTSNTVRAVLQNEALTGRLRYKGEVVDDEDGNPVMVTEEPIMRSYGEWSDLVIKMQTERPSRTAVPSRSMLGGVPTCGSCGSRMSSGKKSRPGATRVYHYYACNAKQTGTCDLPASVRSDDLEMAVNLFIESSIGHLPVYERQGNSISQIKASLEDALSRLETLENKYLAGDYDGEGQEESYQRMHKKLSQRVARARKELAEAESAPVMVATGRTYRETWREKDDEQKRVFLKRHNIEISVAVDGNSKERIVVMRMPDLKEVVAATGLDVPETFDWVTGATMTRRIPAQRKRGKGADLRQFTAVEVNSADVPTV